MKYLICWITNDDSCTNFLNSNIIDDYSLNLCVVMLLSVNE